MSSKAIRDAFRTQLETSFPVVPLIETYGLEVDTETLPDLWFGIGFVATSEERLTLDEPAYWNETGIVRVRVAGEAGEGEDVVIAQSDAVREAFRHWRQDGIEIEFTLPPGEENPESDGKWIFADVDLQYARTFIA